MKTKSIEKALPNSVQVKLGANKEDIFWVKADDIIIDDKTLALHLEEKDKVIAVFAKHVKVNDEKIKELEEANLDLNNEINVIKKRLDDLEVFEITGD